MIWQCACTHFDTKYLLSVFSDLGLGVAGYDSQWDICFQYKAGGGHSLFVEAVTWRKAEVAAEFITYNEISSLFYSTQINLDHRQIFSGKN